MIEWLLQSLFGKKVSEADVDEPQGPLTVIPDDYLLPESPTMPQEDNKILGAGETAASSYEEQAKRIAIERAKLVAAWKAFQQQTSRYMRGQESFQQGGVAAFEAQQALAGLLGPEAQQAAIAQLESSPEFQSMMQQGERAILTNASATGGVRGGNTAGALAQFRPQMLSNIIQQQYSRLGGMSGLGAQAGQGLVGAGLSREQQMLMAQLGLLGTGTELGVGAANVRANAAIAQEEFDLRQKMAEQEYQRARRAQSSQNLSGVATGAIGGTAIGAKIGSVVPGLGTLAGAGIGLLAGGIIGALPMLADGDGSI